MASLVHENLHFLSLDFICDILCQNIFSIVIKIHYPFLSLQEAYATCEAWGQAFLRGWDNFI